MDEKKKINNIKEEHTCDTCKWYNPKLTYIEKEECCGCTACYAICPKEAISMVEDEEGFEYPQIDESKCVRCCRCIKVCPIKAARENK